MTDPTTCACCGTRYRSGAGLIVRHEDARGRIWLCDTHKAPEYRLPAVAHAFGRQFEARGVKVRTQPKAKKPKRTFADA